MRVLLAVDASPDSRNAAGMIRQLADPPDLQVLNVVDVEALKHAYISPGMPEGYYETYQREVSELAERVLHEMRADLAPFAKHIRLIADSGDAAESIVQTAEETHADLVILGQRGMTATPTFLLGGVSQKVAMYAPCSVLVVKGPTPVLDRVVLAVDGSDEAGKATEFLARGVFKGPLGLTIVTVWPRHRAASNAGTEKASGEDFLRRLAARFQGCAYQVETEYLDGDPAFAILEAATRRGAQLTVVGARGFKAIKRFLLGSVSQKVLVHAPCSVLIVR